MATTRKPVVFGRFFGVRLSDDLRRRLAEHTTLHHLSASDIVREALVEFFSRRRTA